MTHITGLLTIGTIGQNFKKYDLFKLLKNYRSKILFFKIAAGEFFLAKIMQKFRKIMTNNDF